MVSEGRGIMGCCKYKNPSISLLIPPGNTAPLPATWSPECRAWAVTLRHSTKKKMPKSSTSQTTSLFALYLTLKICNECLNEWLKKHRMAGDLGTEQRCRERKIRSLMNLVIRPRDTIAEPTIRLQTAEHWEGTVCIRFKPRHPQDPWQWRTNSLEPASRPEENSMCVCLSPILLLRPDLLRHLVVRSSGWLRYQSKEPGFPALVSTYQGLEPSS